MDPINGHPRGIPVNVRSALDRERTAHGTLGSAGFPVTPEREVNLILIGTQSVAESPV